MSDAVPPTNSEVDEKHGRPVVRIIGFIFIFVAVALAWLLVVGYLGYQSGQRQLRDNQQAELQAAVERQLDLAQTDLENGKWELARQRLEWVLERAPNNAQAADLMAVANGARATAVSEPGEVVETTPTPLPEPTATAGPIGSPDEELQRIQRLVATKTWEEALSALKAFQIQFPDYERQTTDQLLYDVYTDYGVELMEGDDVELGLFYISQAEELGDLPQSVQDYQTWGALYTQGISYYGANWDLAAYFFRDLCLAAPFFHNSCDRLHEILVNLGDQYAFSQDWCPAQLVYEEASRQQSSASLADKISQAQEGCLAATPTPSEPISGTVPITDTGSVIEPEPTAPAEP